MDDEPKGDGRTKDTATGKKISQKPEEAIRQQYERILNEDYGYPYGSMDIEAPIVRGSQKQPEAADIVIYDSTDESKRDQFSNILGIIETKRPERKDGVKQLMSYMSATNCSWGVWTNGDEIEYVFRDSKDGKIKRDFIYQIPRNGETVEDMGKITKDNLVPARHLKLVFHRMLQLLYTNTNISRREKLGNELIKIIFCKIWDERYYLRRVPEFRIQVGEKKENVKERIDKLFESVKRELANDGVFDENEQITLDPKSVAYVVGELERYGLRKTDKDVVGDAFEVFAESKLVGEKGEFFTPREVVKMAVDIVDPKPDQTVLDPACGSGGFLIYALEHVWRTMENEPKYRGSSDIETEKKDAAKRCFFGIDKENDLVKIAKAYMAIIGDGRGKITQQNSLHRPEEFEGYAKEVFVSNHKFKKFDVILTNPPFGSKIKVLKEEAGAFVLGNKNSIDKKTKKVKRIPQDTEPQALFIERCLQMLNDGGTLAIVLPETPFHAPSKLPILEFMLKNNNIRAIIDLPHDTFRPYNNAKTILVILEKGAVQQDNIMMAVIEGIGHDALGRQLYRYDRDQQKFTNEIWDDTILAREEFKNPASDTNKHVFVVKKTDIVDNIYVPRYYWKKNIREIENEARLKNCRLIAISDLIKENVLEFYNGHGSPEGRYKGKGNIPYIRVADIVNWDIYQNYTAMIPEPEYNRVKGKTGLDLKKGDVLFVSRGSYRIGTVALITENCPKMLLTYEIKIFRIKNTKNKYSLTAPYLIYLLSHDLVQRQLNNLIFVDTTLPNIAGRWSRLKLPLFENEEDMDYVKRSMNAVFRTKQTILSSISNLSIRHGKLTT